MFSQCLHCSGLKPGMQHLVWQTVVALQGLVVISGELEAAYRSISMAKVPDLWARVSYPSLKPLPSYLEDLYARLAMLQVGCYAHPLCQRTSASPVSRPELGTCLRSIEGLLAAP